VLEDRAVPAVTAIFLVNTTLDVLGHNNGLLSLRQAILDANATPHKTDIIVLPAASSNYTLTQIGTGGAGNLTSELDINGSLTISGAGAASTVIDGAGLGRVFQVRSGTVTLSGVTIQDGIAFAPDSPQAYGAGIYNVATLTVNNCIISGNHADLYGGGIFNNGSLTVQNSTLAGNRTDESPGGGIANLAGTLTVSSCTFSGNAAGGWGGGGIWNYVGNATVTNCTFSGNSATAPSVGYDGTGGGILNSNGTLTVSYSTFSGNSASNEGGGIANGGTLTVSNCTLSSDSAGQAGGGIYNSASGKLTVRGSIVTGNAAPVGADLDNLGAMSLSGSTIGVIGP
jgi:hypothetical protein